MHGFLAPLVGRKNRLDMEPGKLYCMETRLNWAGCRGHLREGNGGGGFRVRPGGGAS